MIPIASKDPHYRAHPKVYSRTHEIELKTGTFEYKLPEDALIAKGQIFGVSARRQSAADDRKSRTGRKIAADAVFNVGFLTIKQAATSTLDSIPLEDIAVDSKTSGRPGEYSQLCCPPEMKTSQFLLNFPDGTAFAANTVIEFTWHYMFPDDCS